MPGKYPTNPALIAALLALRDEQKLTNSAFAKLLGIGGVTETFISEYLNNRLNRQVPDFEVKAFDVLKSIRDRIRFRSEIFDTSVVRRMGNSFDLIRKTGFISLITGPAGVGKSSGINYYLSKHPSAISITLNATSREANKVESLVFDSVDHRDWDGRCSRFAYLVRRFKGASRLLMVDNAQRLASSGRKWLFDFHDMAKNPVALVGNPEILKLIMANDQEKRRIGTFVTYELEKEELHNSATRVASQIVGEEIAEAISDLIAFIAAHDGALGSVEMEVTLMRELQLLSADLKAHPRKALRAAHSRLVRDYELPAD